MSGTTFRRGSIIAPKPMISNQIREKERFELSTLNDKFADYVEKVRYLEAQNKKIQMESNYLQEKQEDNGQKIKSLFESEISQLKALAENLFQNKNVAFTNSQDTQVIHPLPCLPPHRLSISEFHFRTETTFNSNIETIGCVEIRSRKCRTRIIIRGR